VPGWKGGALCACVEKLTVVGAFLVVLRDAGLADWELSARVLSVADAGELVGIIVGAVCMVLADGVDF